MHDFLKLIEAKKKKEEPPDWVSSSPEQIAEQALDLTEGEKSKAISLLQKEYSRHVMRAWAHMSQGNIDKANLFSSVAQKILQARGMPLLKG